MIVIAHVCVVLCALDRSNLVTTKTWECVLPLSWCCSVMPVQMTCCVRTCCVVRLQALLAERGLHHVGPAQDHLYVPCFGTDSTPWPPRNAMRLVCTRALVAARLHGEAEFDFDAAIGLKALQDCVDHFGCDHKFTALVRVAQDAHRVFPV